MPSDDPEARKKDLLDRVRTAHARFERTLAALSPMQMEAEGTVAGWSAKATVGHVTWWEQVPLHALHGEPDEDILMGEAWSTDRANAVLFERNQARRLDDVLDAFRASYTELLRELEALPASRLDETGPYGGSLFELIVGNTYAHYDEHTNLLAAAFGLIVPRTLPGVGGDMTTTPTDDPVVIVDYDPRWPALFDEERARLEPAIDAFAVSINHIGSTAVPGLCAKPIVDLLVTVEQFGAPDQYIPVLADFGYVLRQDPANTERHAFGKRDADGRRTNPGYNLHIVQHGGLEHWRHLAFRDYLRRHPEAAQEYGELKRRLATTHGSNRDAYTSAKTAFVLSIEAQAQCL